MNSNTNNLINDTLDAMNIIEDMMKHMTHITSYNYNEGLYNTHTIR